MAKSPNPNSSSKAFEISSPKLKPVHCCVEGLYDFKALSTLEVRVHINPVLSKTEADCLILIKVGFVGIIKDSRPLLVVLYNIVAVSLFSSKIPS